MPVCAGSYVTVPRSVARFTCASSTPGTFFKPFSIRIAHDAQVMPSSASVVWQICRSSAERFCAESIVCLASVAIASPLLHGNPYPPGRGYIDTIARGKDIVKGKEADIHLIMSYTS